MTLRRPIAGVLHVPVDGFILALAGVVLAATLLPCRGASAHAVHIAGIFAIAALFFLQGARLSGDAIVNGMLHWRLHAASGAATFILFCFLILCRVVVRLGREAVIIDRGEVPAAGAVTEAT